MTDLLPRLEAVAAVLARHGFPALPPFWRDTFARFLRTDARTLVLRVGRRGGKSSWLCLLGVVVAVYGSHAIPAGDVGVIAIVSVSRDEAANRLRTIEAMLRALGVSYRRSGDVIELADRPIVIRTYAATMQGVVGFTAVLVLCDEVARWRDIDTGANPAREVLASLRPTMATVRTARMVLASAPLGCDDAHAEAFDRGDGPDQMVAHAPTWRANPSITEADTRSLERDERVWRREYAAIPQASHSAAFDADTLERAFRAPPAPDDEGDPLLIIDPSNAKVGGDAFTWLVARWSHPRRPEPYIMHRDPVTGVESVALDDDGNRVPDPDHDRPTPPFLRVIGLGAFTGDHGLRVDQIITQLARIAHREGVRRVATDQRDAPYIVAEFARHGLRAHAFTWTPTSKQAAVAALRRLFADGAIYLPDDRLLRAELARFAERITPSGLITYGARTGHDDRAALLLTLQMADAAGLLPMSPIRRPRGGREMIDVIEVWRTPT